MFIVASEGSLASKNISANEIKFTGIVSKNQVSARLGFLH